MRHLFSVFLMIAIVAMVGIGLWQKNGGDFSVLQGNEKLVSLNKQASQIEKAAGKDMETVLSGEADLRRIAEALSDVVTIGWGGHAEDVTTDVKITLAAFPDAGLTIEELRLYGANVGGIESAVAGNEWDELLIADRIDASGIDVFGLNSIAEAVAMSFMGIEADPEAEDTLSEAEVEAIEEMEDFTQEDLDLELTDDPADELPMGIGEYAFTADRMVIDGLTAYPLTGKGKDGEGVMASMATFADWYRASSYERAALWNMTGTFDMTMDIMDMAVVFEVGFSGQEGWRRGDLDNSVTRDFSMEMTQTIRSYLGGEQVTTSSTHTDLQGWHGLEMATLLSYLADGEMPPTSETDVLSLGVMRVEGQTEMAGDLVTSSVESMMIDFSEFHWLLPSAISVEADGLLYNVPGLTEAFLASMSMGSGGLEGEERALLDQVLTIVEEEGLSEPTFDLSMDLAWDPATGSTRFDIDSLLRDGLHEIVDIDVILPTYDRLRVAFETETGEPDWDSLEPMFEEDFAFGGFLVSLEDLGLLDKLFTMIPQFAALIPVDENPQAAMIASQTPDGLRQTVSGLMRMGATQVASEFPPAVDYINAAADFIVEGGMLTFVIRPASPMGQEDFETLFNDPELTPEGIVDALGVRVEHSGADDET